MRHGRQVLIEGRTLHGVLGIARMTLVERSVHPRSWEIFTPASMLMRSLFSRAAFIPGSLRIDAASCGLQLRDRDQERTCTEMGDFLR